MNPLPETELPPPSRWTRVAVAVVVGFLGSMLIAAVTPYNNFVMANAHIADTYMPPAALAILLIIILAINPLLHRLAPRLMLDGLQLSIVLGMLLVACVPPSQGALEWLGYMLAQVPLTARFNKRVADAYAWMNLPPSLFPDKVAFNAETPASQYFVNELPKGESIPWKAWLGPLLAWGSLMTCAWLMMVGLAMLVFPQWRRNERLPFPLLAIQQSLVQSPEPPHALAPLLRQKSFWLVVGAVFLLHLAAGGKAYFPDRVPAIPLDWNVGYLFRENPFQYLPGYIYGNRIYFIFLGVAFFMPSRIGFSIWFFTIAYALYIMIGQAYLPPFYYSTIHDHRWGATVIYVLVILWLGRAHWWHVFRCLVRRAGSEENRKDRKAAVMFLAGCAGIAGWLCWVGVPVPWAIFYTAFGVMSCLLVNRLAAETGIPFLVAGMGREVMFVRLAPLSWLTPATVYFSSVMAILFEHGSRVSGTVMATGAFGLTEKAPPRQQPRYGLLLVAVMVMGLVVAGAVNLSGNYHHSVSLDRVTRPIGWWGLGLLGAANTDLLQLQENTFGLQVYNQTGHILFGGVLAAFLLWMSLATPRWPFHPIGLLMAGTYQANIAWVSIFLGWLSKELVLRYGGARAYHAARPVFMGLIIGEVIAAVFWSVLPAILVLLGKSYTVVWIQPF